MKPFNPASLPKLSFQELESLAFLNNKDFSISDKEKTIADDISTRVCSAYRERLQALYASIPKDNIASSEDVRINMSNADLLRTALNKMESMSLTSVDNGLSNVDVLLKATEEVQMKKFNDGLAVLQAERDSIEAGIRNAHDAKVNALMAQRAELLSKYRQKLEPIDQKIEEVSQSFADIEHLESVYKVKHTDMVIDFDTLTLKEIQQLMRLMSFAMRVVKARTPLAAVASVLYLPAVAKVAHQEWFTVLYLVFLTALIYMLNPYFLGVVSVFFFLNMIVNIFKVYENRKLIQISYLVARDKDKIRKKLDLIIQREPTILELTKALRVLEFEDVDAQVEQATVDVNQRIEAYKATTPKARLDEIRAYVTSPENIKIIKARLDKTIAEEKNHFDRHQQRIRENYAIIMRVIKEYSESLLRFGVNMETSVVMKSRIHASEEYYQGMLIGYYQFPLPFDNIHFVYKDEAGRREMVDLAKLYYINALVNVRPGLLNVSIYDPLNIGSEMAELFDPKMEKILTMETKGFDDTMKKFQDIARNNMYKTGHKSVIDYNTESEKVGRAPLPYYLWILLSSDVDLFTKKEFKAFCDYSTHQGIWVWVVDEYKAKKREDDEDKNLILPVEINKVGEFTHRGNKQCYEKPGTQLITYSMALGMDNKKAVIDYLDNGNMVIIDYEEKYRKVNIPDDKIWTYNTLDGIELHFGFLDGDPTKPMHEMLGDDAVHCLMGGQTGAGKSATINMVIASLLHMYSPEWLQMVMIDFKNVEFSMYTGDCLIPHASIISGTKDGEYAVSVFDWVLSEMKRRQKIFVQNKCQKIKDYNQGVLEGRIKGEIMPRLLMLFDEFQAMFVAVDEAKLDIIRKRIMALSKEARAMGVHMWFTSQSMQGTMSADILEQFKLRSCLSVATAETSKSILGNAASSTLIGKGWIYTNAAGGAEKYNHRYNIPYCSNQYIREYLPKLIRRCYEDKDARGAPIKHIHRHADFYDEDRLHSSDDLFKVYGSQPTLKDDPCFFILGERTQFSENIIPEHLRLIDSDGQNIAICAYDRPDMCNLVSTVLDNIDFKEDSVIVATAGDEDVFSLTNMKSYLNEAAMDLSKKSSVQELITMLVGEVIEREKNRGEEYPQMYYFLLGFDKMNDLDTNYVLWDNLWADLLKRGPAVGVHVIVTCRDPRPMRRTTPFCSHLLCSKTTESFASSFVENSTPSKMADKMCYYVFGTESTKFKIYQHAYDEARLPKKTVLITKAQ